MKLEMLEQIVKIAACVCGKDGVISQPEEAAIFNIIRAEFPNYSFDKFENTLCEFFEENYQLEKYLENISGDKTKTFIIKLCEESASADGLDIKENIALQKVKSILEMDL